MKRSALWVFGAAFGVRLLYFATAYGPSFRDPLIDADYYDYLGVRIASGLGFEEGPFWQPPLYPMILGVLYAVLGHELLWPRLLQALLDALSAVLALRIARVVTGDERYAIAAGLAVAFHGSMLFYSGEILPTSAGIFSGMVALWLAIEHRSHWQRALVCGASVGAGALFVAAVFPLIFPLAWAIAKKRRSHGMLALAAALGVAGCATFANFARSRQLVPISANAGINLFIGNHPDSDRLVAIRPGADWEALASEPEKRGIRTLAGHDAYFAGRAISACVANVPTCLVGFANKSRQLSMSREIPRNENLDVARKGSWVLAALTPRVGSAALPYVVLLPLAAAGLVVAFGRRERAGRLVALALLALAAVPILFFVTGRYRVQLAPELAVLAALGAQKLREGWDKRRREAIAALVVLVLAVWPTHLPVDDVPFESEMFYAIGGRRARLGDDRGAVEAWEEALSLRPDYLEAGFNLGLAFERLGDARLAAAAYRGVLASHPNFEPARERLRAIEAW